MKNKTTRNFLAKWAALAGILCLVFLMVPTKAQAVDYINTVKNQAIEWKAYYDKGVAIHDSYYTSKYGAIYPIAEKTLKLLQNEPDPKKQQAIFNNFRNEVDKAVDVAAGGAGGGGAGGAAASGTAGASGGGTFVSNVVGAAGTVVNALTNTDFCTPPQTPVVGPLLCFLIEAPGKIAGFFLWLASFILWFAGISFEIALRLTLSIKSLIGPGITYAWSALRDFTNIIFIFMMLYMSIETILDRPNNYKKLLKPLIIAAVFINFSFFMTSVVIDASNIMAVGIYESIKGPFQKTTGILDALTQSVQGGSALSARFAGMLGLQTTFSVKSTDPYAVGSIGIAKTTPTTANIPTVNAGAALLISNIMGIGIILIASFVFFAAAILFVVRTGTLLFLLALSPVAFAGNVFPLLSKQSEEWWTALWHQTFFAPAYLICIYVSLLVLSGIRVGDIVTSGIVGLIFGDAIVIFFLLASIKVATQMGAYGAEKAIEYGGKASFGVAAWAGRKTVGNAAQKLGNTNIARQLLGNAGAAKLRDIGAKSTFDLRNVESLGGKKVVGEGDKKGYTEYQDDYLKEKDRQAGTLGLTPYEKQIADGQVAANKLLRDESEKERKKKVDAAETTKTTLISEAKLKRDEKIEEVEKSPEKKALTDKEDALQKEIEAQQEEIKNQKETFKTAVASGKKDDIEKAKTTLEGLVAGQNDLRTQKAAVGKEKENLTAEAEREYQKEKIKAEDQKDDVIRDENRKHTALMEQMDKADGKILTQKKIQGEAIKKYAAREEAFGKAFRFGDKLAGEDPTSKFGRAVKWTGNLTGDVLGSERMLAAAAKVREKTVAKSGKDKIYEAYKDLQKEEDSSKAVPAAPPPPPPAPKPAAPKSP